MSWPIVALGEVAGFVRGVTFKPTDLDPSGIGVMRTKNIQASLDLDDVMRIPRGLVKRSDQFLREGDLLVSTANSWNLVGKACWVPATEEPLAIGGFVAALRRRGDSVDARYLYHWFISPRTQADVRNMGNKTTSISNLNVRRAEKYGFPLPPLEEQRRIAAILDHADALRAKRREALAHLDSLPQSIFHALFDGCADRASFGAMVSEFRYGTSNKSGESGFPTLRIPNVIGGRVDVADLKTVEVTEPELARLRLRAGDLLFVRTNGNPANVGRCAPFQPLESGGDDWIFASYLIRARLGDRLAPEFAATYFASAAGREQLRAQSKTSAGQFNINIDGLSGVTVPLPPLALQQDFARHMTEVDAQRSRAQAALAASDELFASLQSRAFRGEL